MTQDLEAIFIGLVLHFSRDLEILIYGLYCIKELQSCDILKEMMYVDINDLDDKTHSEMSNLLTWMVPCSLFDLITQLGFSVPMRPSSIVACGKSLSNHIEYIKDLLEVNNQNSWPSIDGAKSEWRNWVTDATLSAIKRIDCPCESLLDPRPEFGGTFKNDALRYSLFGNDRKLFFECQERIAVILTPLLVDPCICRIEPCIDVTKLKFDGIETTDIIDGIALGAIWRTMSKERLQDAESSNASQLVASSEVESCSPTSSGTITSRTNSNNSSSIDELLNCVNEVNMRLNCSLLRFICLTGSQIFPIVSQEYEYLKVLIKYIISYYQGPHLADEDFEGFFSIFTECGHILDVLSLLNYPQSDKTEVNEEDGKYYYRGLQLSHQVKVSCHRVLQVLKQLKGCQIEYETEQNYVDRNHGTLLHHTSYNTISGSESSSIDVLIKSLRCFRLSDFLDAFYKLLYVLDDRDRVDECHPVTSSTNSSSYITKYPGKNSIVRDLIELSTLYNSKNGL